MNSKNIKGGVIISYLSLFLSIIAGIFITPIVIKNVGTDSYGIFNFTTSVVSWLTILSAALSASYIHFATKEHKENGGEGITNSIFIKLLVLIGMGLLFLFTIVIIVLYFSGFSLPQYTEHERNLIFLLLLLSALHVAISICFSTFNLFINYKEKFLFSKTIALIFNILNFALNLILAVSTHSIIYLAVSSLVLTTISNLIFLIYCCRKLKISFKKVRFIDSKRLVLSIFAFSGIILLNTITNEINNQVDKQILGFMVDSQSVTLYQLSFSFVGYISSMSVAISSVFVPLINREAIFGNKDIVNKTYVKVSSIQTIVICFFVCGFIAIGKEFIELWIGGLCEGYENVYYYTIALLLTHLIPCCTNLFIEIQRAYEKICFRAVVYLSAAVANIVLTIILIKIMGKTNSIWSCIIGTFISTTLGTVIIIGIYNQKVLKLPTIKIYIKIILTVLIFSILGILISKFMNFTSSLLINFLIKGAVFSLIYLLLSFLTNRKLILDALVKN